jgi:hypothetical protein
VAQLSPTQFNGLTGSILLVALLLAILVPNVEFVFGLIGASVCVYLGFIIPSLSFIRLKYDGSLNYKPRAPLLPGKQRSRTALERVQACLSRWEVLLAYAMLAMGLVMAVGGTMATVGAVKEEVEVVSLATELAAYVGEAEAAASRVEAVQEAARGLRDAQSTFVDLDKAQLDTMALVERVNSMAATMEHIQQARPNTFHKGEHHSSLPARRRADRQVAEAEASLAEVRNIVNSTLTSVLEAAKKLEQLRKEKAAAQTSPPPPEVYPPPAPQVLEEEEGEGHGELGEGGHKEEGEGHREEGEGEEGEVDRPKGERREAEGKTGEDKKAKVQIGIVGGEEAEVEKRLEDKVEGGGVVVSEFLGGVPDPVQELVEAQARAEAG